MRCVPCVARPNVAKTGWTEEYRRWQHCECQDKEAETRIKHMFDCDALRREHEQSLSKKRVDASRPCEES